jgi:hypothetical protein
MSVCSRKVEEFISIHLDCIHSSFLPASLLRFLRKPTGLKSAVCSRLLSIGFWTLSTSSFVLCPGSLNFVLCFSQFVGVICRMFCVKVFRAHIVTELLISVLHKVRPNGQIRKVSVFFSKDIRKRKYENFWSIFAVLTHIVPKKMAPYAVSLTEERGVRVCVLNCLV